MCGLKSPKTSLSLLLRAAVDDEDIDDAGDKGAFPIISAEYFPGREDGLKALEPTCETDRRFFFLDGLDMVPKCNSLHHNNLHFWRVFLKINSS